MLKLTIPTKDIFGTKMRSNILGIKDVVEQQFEFAKNHR